MHYPQILVYEGDGRLAALLRALAEEQRWSLREPRRMEGCLRLLSRGGPAVLVIKVGRNLETELTLVERVHGLYPDVGIVLVGDAEQAQVAGLAWDLGADCVHFPPLPRESLPEIVQGLLSPPRQA
jgi:hypothetical protein